MSKRETPHPVLVVAERGPSETKPRPVDIQPEGQEASTAGCPSDDCALQTRTVSPSAVAEPEEDLHGHRGSKSRLSKMNRSSSMLKTSLSHFYTLIQHIFTFSVLCALFYKADIQAVKQCHDQRKVHAVQGAISLSRDRLQVTDQSQGVIFAQRGLAGP